LNYIIFAHTENHFVSKTIQSTVESNDRCTELGQENSGYLNIGFLELDNLFGMGYQPIGMDEIYNFLAPDWAVK